MHRDISVQYEPTGCTNYFQLISIINLYTFRAGLLLIIRRYYSVCTAIDIRHAFMLTGCWQDCQQPVNINEYNNQIIHQVIKKLPAIYATRQFTVLSQRIANCPFLSEIIQYPPFRCGPPPSTSSLSSRFPHQNPPRISLLSAPGECLTVSHSLT